ncbi:MAG: zinc-binding dehydrogenase [FCB group bacterium]|nr:zinc-binding dehydrogenase [FCB group bacterium]
MRQIWISKHGGPEVLEIRETRIEDPGPNQVQVRVHYAGINFADILARMGLYPGAPKPPFVPGYEISGVIEKTGSAVDPTLTGKPVIGITQFNGYSSSVNLTTDRVVFLDSSEQLRAGVVLPVNYLTAYLMLINQTHVQAGEWVLIHGIGGGVGIAALQIARILGARIIGTASAHKHERLKQLGVENPIDYRKEDFLDRVMEITGGAGADVILDPVGGAHLKRSYRALAGLGRLVAYGFSASAIGPRKKLLPAAWEYLRFPKFHPVKLISHNKGVFGFHLGMVRNEETLKAALATLMEWLRTGRIDPVVDRVFPFSQVQAAHEYIAARKNFGKVLLAPDDV